MTFEEIISNLDREAIATAILAVEEGETLPDWDFDDAKRLVWEAGEKWLVRDLEEFTLDQVERDSWDNEKRLHGFLDVCGKIRGIKEPFKQFKDKNYVIDWKTSKNTLSTDWRNRLLDSWQGQYYSYLYDAPIVIFRGLSRTGSHAEIIINQPESNFEEVTEMLVMLKDQVDNLSNYPVWPRNKPFACNAYGRECLYIKDCQDYTMPKQMVQIDHLSYSFANDLMLCNERARRGVLLSKGEGSEETNFGSACHRGLAEMWKQAYTLL